MAASLIHCVSVQSPASDRTGIARDAVEAVLDRLGYQVDEWCRDTGPLDISLPPEAPAAVLAACYAAAEAALSVQGSAAATLGRLGGKAKSEAKAAAVRANGAKGGRPRYIGCSLPGEIGIKIQGRRATICSNRGGFGRGYMEEGTMAESGATGEEAYRKLASRLGWPDEVAASLWK